MINWDYVYDRSAFKYQDVNHYVEKDLSYKEYKNGYILPYKVVAAGIGGGIVSEDGEFIEETALNKKGGVSYDFDKDTVSYSEETVIYIGMFVGVWGHCITDNIRRVWFLKTSEYKEKFAGCKLVYVPFKGFEFGNNFKQFLMMLGVDSDDLLPITEITQYKNIVLPDECFYKEDGSVRYFTKEYRELVSEICSHAAPSEWEKSKYEKVYFTHSQFAGSRQIGEHKLENFFKAQGYEIVAPEKYTFQEQLNMLASCKYFASTIGSCAHNMMYLRPGASVILIPRANYLTGYQMAINQVVDLNITIIDSSLSLFVNRSSPWVGPFYYYVSDRLMDYFGMEQESRREYWKSNFDEFGDYIRLGTRLGNHLRGKMPDIYYLVASQGYQKYIEAKSIGAPMEQRIKDAYNNLKELLVDLEHARRLLQKQNFYRATNILKRDMVQLEKVLVCVMQEQEYFLQAATDISRENIMFLLDSLISALEEKEYVLLADVLSQSMIPFLYALQEHIVTKELNEPVRFCTGFRTYQVEYTSCGLPTIKILDGGKEFYLHSNRNARQEAEEIAAGWLERGKTEYIIYGMGLGYAVTALLEENEKIFIRVFESDAILAKLSCQYGDYNRLVASGRVQIEVDETGTNFFAAAAGNPKAQLAFFYPSLRLISDKKVSEQMERLFSSRMLFGGMFDGESERSYTQN